MPIIKITTRSLGRLPSISDINQLCEDVARVGATVEGLYLKASDFWVFVNRGDTANVPVTLVEIKAYAQPGRTPQLMKRLADTIGEEVSLWSNQLGLGKGVAVTLGELNNTNYFEYYSPK